VLPVALVPAPAATTWPPPGGQGQGRIVEPGEIDLILPDERTVLGLVRPDEKVLVAGGIRAEPGREDQPSFHRQSESRVIEPSFVGPILPTEGTALHLVRPHQEILVAGRALATSRREDLSAPHGQGLGDVVEPGWIALVFPAEGTSLRIIRPHEEILIAVDIGAKARGEHLPCPCRKGEGPIGVPGRINPVFPKEAPAVGIVRPHEEISVAGGVCVKSSGEHQPAPHRQGIDPISTPGRVGVVFPHQVPARSACASHQAEAPQQGDDAPREAMAGLPPGRCDTPSWPSERAGA
jgi:hypothetical protein